MADDQAQQTATLIVSCRDRKGLVASLAQLLYGHGANILDADQHTDQEAGQFLQRIHFDLRELHTDRVALERGIAEVAERFGMQYRLSYGTQVRRIAIFVSKYDHCLYDLLLRHRAGELRCQIALIVSNHPDLAPVAAQFAVPFHAFPIDPQNKPQQELRQRELCEQHEIDLIVLARYMQV